MKPWQVVAIAASGVLLALAIFTRSFAVTSLMFLPYIMVLVWGIAVLVYLRGILEELRGLRRDRAPSSTGSKTLTE